MVRPPRGPRLWLAPLLGGMGMALGVVGWLGVVRDRGSETTYLTVIVALSVLVIVLAVLLAAEERGWRSTASLVGDLEERLASREHALTEAGKSDALTGLRNRVAFYEILDLEFRQAERNGVPLSCVLIDIDHFRRLNDRFGHHFGDVVLVAFTHRLTRLLRGADVICRYGGDQFVLLLPESDATQAEIVAERVRKQLKREVFSDGTAAAAVTASFGIAATPVPGVTGPGALIEHLEAALADAKRRGRDRIVVDPAALESAGP